MLTWIKTVVELFPVVQPNLDQTGIIVIDYLRGAAGEGVRRRFAEHVTHTGAGRDLEHAAAHPHLDIFRIGFRFRGLCVCVFICSYILTIGQYNRAFGGGQRVDEKDIHKDIQ